MTKETTTLVERLRAYNALTYHGASRPIPLINEAAAEIDRLSRIEEKYTNLCAVLNEQTAEIERLRAALDFYADESNWVDKYNALPYCEADRDMGMRAREAFRASLAHEPP